ncbi:MAG TPA: hypothetical protein VD837_02910 [Terriglobales bacterium]|nr:hypothetical protein [Terriglobales bacterium]
MSRASSVFCSYRSRLAIPICDVPELSEYRIKVVTSRHKHCGTDSVEFEKRAKSIEITIKRLILAVPFDVESNAPFYIIDLMRITPYGIPIDNEFCLELHFFPAKRA